MTSNGEIPEIPSKAQTFLALYKLYDMDGYVLDDLHSRTKGFKFSHPIGQDGNGNDNQMGECVFLSGGGGGGGTTTILMLPPRQKGNCLNRLSLYPA